MKLFGTVVNDHVRLDTPAALPDGRRVSVDTDEEDDTDPVLPDETYAEHLTKLRESIARAQSGELGRSVAEVFDELERQFDRPPTRKD